MKILLLVLSPFLVSGSVILQNCEEDQDAALGLGKLVYFYGDGETEETKTAIAYTVVNRRDSPYFPNTTTDVINWSWSKNRKVKKYYAILMRPNAESRWNAAKRSNSEDYQTTTRVARDVMCGEADDPTGGATAFSRQPVPRFFRAPRNMRATESGMQIGGLYFFKLAPNIAGRWGDNRGGRRRGGGGRGGEGGGRRGRGRGHGGRGGRWRGGAGRRGGGSRGGQTYSENPGGRLTDI